MRLRLPRVRSLRTRLGLWAAVVVLAALAVFGAFVYFQVERSLLDTLDDSLQVSAALAASDVSVAEGALVIEESMEEVNLEMGVLLAQGDSIRYLDLGGETITGFGAWRMVPSYAGSLEAASGASGVFTDTPDVTGDSEFRVYTMPLLDDDSVVGFVQAIHDTESLRQSMRKLLDGLLIGGGALALVTWLIGYLLARRALAPIDRMTKTARHISAQDLSARLDLSGSDDEVGRLAATFDEMLERLDQSFQRERRFTADASHELRTPLAAMEAILGVVRSEPRATADYEQALNDLADEAARLRTLVERLLELARSGRSAATESALVDVSTLVDDVCEALSPLSGTKDITVECHLKPGLLVKGDSDSLIRLFVNLVENAIKFTDHGSVTVNGSELGDEVVIEVTDTGAGIPAAQLPHVFERFYRGDPSRSAPGSGLGLALARQIAMNHQGALTAKSTEGKGSTFTVTLPKASD